MREYSGITKNIANVIIIIIICMLLLSGCFTSKPVLTSDLPVAGNSRYILRYNKSKYLVLNPVFTNDSISGNIKIYSSGYRTKIYLYLPKDSALILRDKSYIKIDLNQVVRAESRKTNVFLTTITVIAVLVVLTPLKYIFIGGYDM